MVNKLGEEVFTPEPEYAGPMNTLGNLSQGYVENTLALRRANNKLQTICEASPACKNRQIEHEATE